MPRLRFLKHRQKPGLLFLLLLATAATASAQLQPATRPAVSKAQNGDARLYTAAEYMPVYPGGRKQLQQDIAANLRYPKSARPGQGGRILVGFTVGADGAVRDVKLVQGLTAATGQEQAVRALEAAGLQAVRDLPAHWTPGLQNNKRVAVYLLQPLLLQP